MALKPTTRSARVAQRIGRTSAQITILERYLRTAEQDVKDGRGQFDRGLEERVLRFRRQIAEKQDLLRRLQGL